MTYLGFKVFDAELYAPGRQYQRLCSLCPEADLSAQLQRQAIAESSVKEIRRQGGVSAKLSRLGKADAAIFPNVARGPVDHRCPDRRPAAPSSISGSRKLGTIADRAFTRKFFAIWLGNNTRNPQLRARLVGTGS